VDLSRQLQVALSLSRRQQRRAWVKVGRPFPVWVFASVTGTALDEANVRKAFNRVLAAAELDARGPHQMRHYAAFRTMPSEERFRSESGRHLRLTSERVSRHRSA
jgi:integrase